MSEEKTCAVVLERAEIPASSLVMGSPGKVRRQTTEAELEGIRHGAEGYVNKMISCSFLF